MIGTITIIILLTMVNLLTPAEYGKILFFYVAFIMLPAKSEPKIFYIIALISTVAIFICINFLDIERPTLSRWYFGIEAVFVLWILAWVLANRAKTLALVEEKKRVLEAILEIIPVGIAITDSAGHIQHSNKYLEKYTDSGQIKSVTTTEDEFLGWQTIETPDGIKVDLKDTPLHKARNTGEISKPVIFRYSLRGDGWGYASVSAGPIKSERGKITGAVGSWVDVTELFLAHKTAEENATRDEAILNNMTDGLMLHSENGACVYMNPTAKKLHDVPETTNELDSVIKQIDGSTVVKESWPFMRALRGERFTGYELLIENNRTGKEWIGSYTGAPVYNDNGKLLYAIITVLDITLRKRLEDQIRNQALMLEQVYDAVITIDTSEHIQYMNNAAYRLYEIDRSEPVLGSKLGEFFRFHWKNHKQLESYLHAIRAEGVWKGEKIHETHKNKQIWGESVISVVKDIAGKPAGVVAVVRDISMRKKAEEELMESRERLRLANEVAGIGNWSFNVLSNKIEWDNTTREHWGFAHTDDLPLDIIIERLVPEDRQKIHESITTVTSGKSFSNMQLRVLRPDGSLHYLFSTGLGINDEFGNVTRIIGTSLDITEQKRVEIQLRDERNFADTIFDIQGAIVVILDKDFKIIRANRAYNQASKSDNESVVKKNFWDFIVVKNKELVRKKVSECITSTVDGEYEDILPIKDDTIHYVKWRITAVRKNGFIEFLIATGIDITERIEAERAIDRLNKDLERHADELEYSNKELESFSYSVSHDLKSPLRSIVGLSQILLEDYAEYVDDEGHELINRIVNNGKHMSQLIDDILVLSRVTRQEITLQKINLSSVADMIVSDLQKNQPDRTIEIKIQQNCITNADARLMNIVLTNIIGNAWKYTQKKDNPRIEFGCLKKNDKTVFFVKDNGAGFDIKQIGKLFIPFQRLHSDNDFPGIGVGLATVARIIKRHHGEIWAEGEPDKGATFYFVIGGGK